jgi:hypothetical protein
LAGGLEAVGTGTARRLAGVLLGSLADNDDAIHTIRQKCASLTGRLGWLPLKRGRNIFGLPAFSSPWIRRIALEQSASSTFSGEMWQEPPEVDGGSGACGVNERSVFP